MLFRLSKTACIAPFPLSILPTNEVPWPTHQLWQPKTQGKRLVKLARLLIRTMPAVAIAVFSAVGCASSLQRVDLSALHGVREPYFPEIGAWREDEGGVVNAVPADASPAEVAQSVGGAGVSLGLFPGFRARDLVIEAQVAFKGLGAPGLAFRVQDEGGVVKRMDLLVLSRTGVRLWNIEGEIRKCVYTHAFPLAEDALYELRARARGSTIEVNLNGQRLFVAQGGPPAVKGGAGVSAREGPCLIKDVAVASLD